MGSRSWHAHGPAGNRDGAGDATNGVDPADGAPPRLGGLLIGTSLVLQGLLDFRILPSLSWDFRFFGEIAFLFAGLLLISASSSCRPAFARGQTGSYIRLVDEPERRESFGRVQVVQEREHAAGPTTPDGLRSP